MKLENAVCSTRLRRVQFGVPPNCGKMRAAVLVRTDHDKLRPFQVSGETPQTTRETRVLQHFLLGFGVSAVQTN